MITIKQLMHDYDFGLLFVAGEGGKNNSLSWAHAVEIPDPWLCELSGTLLMITGVGMPRGSAEQIVWIQNLIASQAQGLLFAPRDPEFKLSKEMLSVADEHQFPILLGSFELEFVEIAQVVIKHALQETNTAFTAGNQIFKIYSETLWETDDLSERLKLLGTKLSSYIQIISNDSLQVMFSSSTTIKNIENPVRVMIPGKANAALIVSNNTSKILDTTLLAKALSGLLSVDLERIVVKRDQQRKDGSELFLNLLEGELEYSAIKTWLERRGLFGKLVIVAISAINNLQKYETLHHLPIFHSISPLLFKDDKKILMVIPDDPKIVEAIIRYFGESSQVGISSSIQASNSFKESVFQANLMLSRVSDGKEQVARYRDLEVILGLGPKTLSESRALVEHYFSPLMTYEKGKSVSLLETLAFFLKYDCNWKLTAGRLAIHRQTLVYRLKLIEDLTGIKPTSSMGIAKFWIVIEAAKVLGILDDLDLEKS